MDQRFEYVIETDMQALVKELNRRANSYHFSVVYMQNSVAVIDTLVAPVVLVEESDFEAVATDHNTPVSPNFA